MIQVGDEAVPALIDAMEKDERLTCAVEFHRDFFHGRTVLGVRDAELAAIRWILRVALLAPNSTDYMPTYLHDAGEVKDTAKRLRAYWKEYGALPFHERMMKVLTDPKIGYQVKHEAAANLACRTEDRRWYSGSGPGSIVADPECRPNLAVMKFDKPTVAEAILSAPDADLKAFDAKPPKDNASDNAYYRRGIEDRYIWALVELGDKRIVPELAKRAAGAKAIRGRRQWAQAAHFLGDPKPFRAFAQDFRAGKIELPIEERSNDDELSLVLSALISVETPEAERALEALASPKHPQHKAFRDRVIKERPDGHWDGQWFARPVCLPVLREALDDTSLTGVKYAIKEGLFWKVGISGEGIPDFLAERAVRREEAEERVCDAAMENFGALVAGLPLYHPLFKNAEKRLAAVKTAFDRFAGNYRKTTWRENEILGRDSSTLTYLPDIRPLGRAATAKDVKEGKAIFHLEGKNKPAEIQLPAMALMKIDAKRKVLILQAEVSSDGQVTYGVITHGGILKMSGEDLTGIQTFAELEKQEEEAAKQRAKHKD